MEVPIIMFQMHTPYHHCKSWTQRTDLTSSEKSIPMTLLLHHPQKPWADCFYQGTAEYSSHKFKYELVKEAEKTWFIINENGPFFLALNKRDKLMTFCVRFRRCWDFFHFLLQSQAVGSKVDQDLFPAFSRLLWVDHKPFVAVGL